MSLNKMLEYILAKIHFIVKCKAPSNDDGRREQRYRLEFFILEGWLARCPYEVDEPLKGASHFTKSVFRNLNSDINFFHGDG